MAKDQTVTFGSPFKFGFFAGIGFFFASLVMTCISMLLIALLGLGTIGALIAGGHAASNQPPEQPKPVRTQVSSAR